MIEENTDPTVDQLANLAMEIDIDKNIDWSQINMTKEQVFTTMAKNVYEQFSAMENQDEAAIVALATIVKLLVENLIYKSSMNAGQNENV
jgi:hypothetical protein